MRRTQYVASASSIVVLLGVAIVIWWRPSPESKPVARRTADGQAGAVAETAAPVSELTLQIDGTTTATISTGSSVLFTVTLTGPAPEQWVPGLRFETADGQPLAFRIDLLASPTGGDGSEASAMHRAELGINPDEAVRIPTGLHAIRAVLDLNRNQRLVSNTVRLVIDGQTPSPSGEKARLESAAQFHLLSQQWADAHTVALQLVERQDADAAAYIALGDALNGLRRDDEALAAYHEALASLPNELDESPDYLIARMEEVQQRIEAAKRKK